MSFTRNVSVANASVANASVADDFEFNEDIDWEEVWANEEPVTDDENGDNTDDEPTDDD